MNSFIERLAVCSWSLRPKNAEALFSEVKAVGIPRIQLALDPLRENPDAWDFFGERCREHGIEIVSGMFGTVGEDYSSLESIRRTGGIVPDATWEENERNIRTNAEIAAGLGLRLVTFHAGFIPHDPADPTFETLLERVRTVADIFAEKGIVVAFETGQEEAETLRGFLEEIDRENIGVNFDPANMLLYDQGDPVAALRVLAPWLRQCHIKDALRPRRSGEWGEEVRVGLGEVDWLEFLNTIRELGFAGHCAIEREAGEERVRDIAIAREFVSRLSVGRERKVRRVQPVRIGIVGAGFMAATHIRAYEKIEGAEIVAIYNPSGRNLNGDFSDAGGNIGEVDPVILDMSGVTAYRDFEKMLEDPGIDLIDICSPTRTHAEFTIAALEAGRHVLCEKPVARNMEQARAMTEAARGAKGFLMPGMCLRFWPHWDWLKRAIAEHRYGNVLAARFRRVAEPPVWGRETYLAGNHSGGALFDLHIHDTDFVQYCFGKPRSVLSTGYSKFSGAVDHVFTRYEVADGCPVHAEGSWSMTPGFGFNMAYTVNFERATADYDIGREEAPLRLYEDGKSSRAIHCGDEDGYFCELQYFLNAIRAGEAPTVVTPEDGVVSLEICEAEERSIESGEIVRLGEREKGEGRRGKVEGGR